MDLKERTIDKLHKELIKAGWLKDDGSVNSYRARYFKAEANLVVQLQKLYPGVNNTSELLYLISKKMEVPPVCPGCGMPAKFKTISQGYTTYCSTKCLNGSDAGKRTKSAAVQKKYGVSHYSRTKQYKERYTKTCQQRYGVANPNQSEEVKAKKRSKAQQRYGVGNVSQAQEVKQKVAQTKRRKSVDAILHSDRLRGLVTPLFDVDTEYRGIDHTYPWRCVSCNSEFKDHLKFGKVPTCPTCYKSSMPYSKVEHEVRNFVRSLGFAGATSSREVVSPKEVDIWVPEKQVAIEVNGIYHHSEIKGGKDKQYHLFKTLVCDNKGIRLLQFWDIECTEKRDIVESMIRNALGKTQRRIYARACEVRPVDNAVADAFLDATHLQGKAAYSRRLGLYHKGELVSLATFSKARHNKKVNWELVRFSSALNTQVVGGFSKLLKAFRAENPGSIVTYADKRFSKGAVYEATGFQHSHTSKPNYWYTHKPRTYIKIVSRLQFQKHKLKSMKSYDPKLTEWQIMQLEGYDRVWDCGNEVFVLD